MPSTVAQHEKHMAGFVAVYNVQQVAACFSQICQSQCQSCCLMYHDIKAHDLKFMLVCVFLCADIVKHDFGVDLVPICGWPLCWQLCDGVCRC